MTFRLIYETLPHLHRTAGALALVTANYPAAFALARWRVLVKRVVYHCQNLHSSQVDRNFLLERTRRRLALQNAAWEEGKENRRRTAAHAAALIADAKRRRRLE